MIDNRIKVRTDEIISNIEIEIVATRPLGTSMRLKMFIWLLELAAWIAPCREVKIRFEAGDGSVANLIGKKSNGRD